MTLTQGQWAARIGISRSYLCLILSDEREPGKRTMEKIRAATGVPISAWFEPEPQEGQCLASTRSS
ncbi:helix-turn-helix transcriptional regulator [Rhodovulum sp. BSW8]|uniref:helix-turn-helix transcriptional regulator n=1 Tax=Rhodovulum sp. BSW8 TaxID=2259645 RepID=UPI001A9F56F0|nr:helix-turn-helix transcriptional regulator [Rhodovulum sp. BSW8]